MNNSGLLVFAGLMALGPTHAAAPIETDDGQSQQRPLPPVERVLTELGISDRQRTEVRMLLEQWRTEARREREARRLRQRHQLAAILNHDQVVAVLAALPPAEAPIAPTLPMPPLPMPPLPMSPSN